MPDTEKTNRLPAIAIVGRPNVGKSSLFNSILGRRLAIVHEMSGVTRDRVAAPVSRGGRRFTLIDTGGLGMLSGESRKVDRWDAGIAEQVEAAVSDADVLIMVGDAQAGVTPLDRDVAARLRTAGKKVLFAANKCDDDSVRNDAAEFSSLGFGNPYPVSCLHRGGIPALLDAALKLLPPPVPLELTPPRLNLAVIGRPNVGKSSLVNALTGSRRVMTSPIAGTTRDAVDIEFSFLFGDEKVPALLVDTAGLRKTAKVDSVVELFSVMRAKSAIERADLVIFVMEAGDAGATAQDRKIAGLIQKAGKACVIAANKVDLCSEQAKKDLLNEIRETVPGLGYAPVALISAQEQKGLDRLLELVGEVRRQSEMDVSTGLLNRVLGDAFTANPPPVSGISPLKLFYAVTAGKKPHRFKLFVNRKEAAVPHYVNYLKNKLRAAFDLTGVPIELEFCPRPKTVESFRRPEPGKGAPRGTKRRNGTWKSKPKSR